MIVPGYDSAVVCGTLALSDIRDDICRYDRVDQFQDILIKLRAEPGLGLVQATEPISDVFTTTRELGGERVCHVPAVLQPAVFCGVIDNAARATGVTTSLLASARVQNS